MAIRHERPELPRLKQRDRYGLLLVMILASLLLVVFSDQGPVGRLVSFAAIAVTLLFALHTSEPDARTKRVIWGALALCVAVAAVFTIVGRDEASHVAISGMTAFLVAVTLAAIMHRLALHPRIDLETVGGALCAYLLLGLFFAFTFMTLAAAIDAPFFVQEATPNAVDFVYFSFVTLSTTGYGDLSAAGNLGRMLAVSEAVIGQLYLVSAVALVIGNLGSERPMRADVEAAEIDSLDPEE